MLRDRSLTVFARANDILHQSKNISRTVNANLISDSETNNLTRYFMFGITWKFSTLGKGGSSKINPQEMPHGDFPGPPPGLRQGGQRPPRGNPGPPPSRL